MATFCDDKFKKLYRGAIASFSNSATWRGFLTHCINYPRDGLETHRLFQQSALTTFFERADDSGKN